MIIVCDKKHNEICMEWVVKYGMPENHMDTGIVVDTVMYRICTNIVRRSEYRYQAAA